MALSPHSEVGKYATYLNGFDFNRIAADVLDIGDLERNYEFGQEMVYRRAMYLNMYTGCGTYLLLYPFIRTSALAGLRYDIRRAEPDVRYRFTYLKWLLFNESIIRLWRGAIPATIQFSGLFLTIHACKQVMGTSQLVKYKKRDPFPRDVALRYMAATGILMGYNIVTHPLTLARIKLAGDTPVRSLHRPYQYLNTLDVWRQIYKYNGIGGFFAGMRGSLLYTFSFCALYGLLRHGYFRVNSSPMERLIGPVPPWTHEPLSVMWTAIFTTPFYAIMNRSVYRIPTSPPPHLKFVRYTSLRPAGLFGLFRGCIPHTISIFSVYATSRFIDDRITNIMGGNQSEDSQKLISQVHLNVTRRYKNEGIGIVPEYPRYMPVPEGFRD